MIINQYDIVKTNQPFECDGIEYNHYLITFPCEDANTVDMWLVDAIAFDPENNSTPEGYYVGMPTHTDNFSHVITNLYAQ
jgi:hypothetical protein